MARERSRYIGTYRGTGTAPNYGTLFKHRKAEKSIAGTSMSHVVDEEIRIAAREVAKTRASGGKGTRLPDYISSYAVKRVNANIPGFKRLVRDVRTGAIEFHGVLE